MTEMVHRELGKYTGEPVFPKWWHTVDRWTLISVVLLFGIGVLLNFAASPPLAERNGFASFHYVQRQIIFGGLGPTCKVSSLQDNEILNTLFF